MISLALTASSQAVLSVDDGGHLPGQRPVGLAGGRVRARAGLERLDLIAGAEVNFLR